MAARSRSIEGMTAKELKQAVLETLLSVLDMMERQELAMDSGGEAEQI